MDNINLEDLKDNELLDVMSVLITFSQYKTELEQVGVLNISVTKSVSSDALCSLLDLAKNQILKEGIPFIHPEEGYGIG